VGLLKIRTGEIPKFRRSLLKWFATTKRDLPWRRTQDQPGSWLYEAML
jgi:adenine-specific DNA glycosylase